MNPARNTAIVVGMTMPYGFHLFRHSAGSQMQEVTGDFKQTQSFLGTVGSELRVTFTFTCNPIPKLSP
jgi:site-specific recombinase XerC